jgi:hypothetical protein
VRKILDTIPARGVLYEVIVTNDPEILPRDSDGYIDPDKEYIAVSSNLKLQIAWATLIHEWVHAQIRHHKKEYEDDVLVDDIAVGIVELLKFIGYLK